MSHFLSHVVHSFEILDLYVYLECLQQTGNYKRARVGSGGSIYVKSEGNSGGSKV